MFNISVQYSEFLNLNYYRKFLFLLSASVVLLTLSCSSESGGDSDNQTVPSITSTPLTNATAGTLYTYSIVASGDPTPVITVVNAPQWLVFDGTDTLTGTPNVGDIGLSDTITVTAANGLLPDASQSFSITVLDPNDPLEITIITPTQKGGYADSSYKIEWSDSAPESDASISLYYETDPLGTDGTLIQSGISEDSTTDSFNWDTQLVPPGKYYICATINDNLNSPVTDCAKGALIIDHHPEQNIGTTISVDVSLLTLPVHQHLFGDQIEWTNNAEGLWNDSTWEPYPELLGKIDELDLTLLRYPGGTLSDFFHWQEAVGPPSSRIPQIDPFSSSSATDVVTDIPNFGPDEFTDLAATLDTDIMLTANVGTGTATEAGEWAQYCMDNGVDVEYWEIGNEIYIDGPQYHFNEVAMSAMDYALAFNDFAAEIRMVDPTAKIGIVGNYNSEEDPKWNDTVFQNITERADFIALHTCYAPFVQTTYNPDHDYVFGGLFGSVIIFDWIIQQVEAQIAANAPAHSSDITIAITEHSPFYAPLEGESYEDIVNYVAQNRMLGSALFSALTYNLFIEKSSITISNHINIYSALWQAMFYTDTDQHSNPTPTSFHYVYQLYRDAADGLAGPATVESSPTYETTATYVLSNVTVQSIQSVAVDHTTNNQLYVYVINADLDNAIISDVSLTNLAGKTITSVSVDRLTGTGVNAMVDVGDTSSIAFETYTIPTSTDFEYRFPPYSLTRFTFYY